MPDFCHLHSHTQYSLLDGAADIKSLIKKASADAMKAIAITDHGNMFGAFEFVNEANKQKIKPIVGCELYVVPDRFKKELIAGFGDDEDKSTKGKKAFHQVLLAKNEIGYKNLSMLCTLGFLDGYYYNPRVDFGLIKQYHEGLIATTCCLAGTIPQHILYKSEEEAEKVFLQWLEVFGDDYYVELQRHGIPEQEKVNQVLLKFAAKHNVKIIATNDSHYVNQEDAEAQDILLCLQTGKDFQDPRRMRFDNDQFFFKTKSQMIERFSDLPQALDNTVEIADKVNLINLHRDILLPSFPLPKGYKSNFEYLQHLTWNGAKERYPVLTEEINQRLKYELEIIDKTGFAGYFLIVQDFITEAKRIGVKVGPGRGSAAGSAVAYCVGITNVDPIHYNLLFERFLNPERISMPDMDIDFDDVGRQKVIDYVVKKYGENQVAQIVTFGTMGPKTGIRDVARVLQLPLHEATRIAKLIPDKPGVSFASAMAEVKELSDLQHSTDITTKKTIKIARTLEGCARQTGIHAAGVIIAPSDIRQHVPVFLPKEAKMLVTQYEGKFIEDAGLLKMDFLGLKTLSVMNRAIEMIDENYGVKIIPEEIPFTDQKTLELFQRGETVGIFQFESPGMQKSLKELKPTSLEDLIAMNALYRPGPMDNIPEYIARKHGRSKTVYPHPKLEGILKNTFGIMVYQEQIMQIAQLVANYTLGKADKLRKAMGKKDMVEMQKHKEGFIENALTNGLSAKEAADVFAAMEKFAEYGFNRSHSVAYAVIAFQNGFLKANYPAEFMSALMSVYRDKIEDTQYYMNEARHMGINVLGPDVNESEINFIATKPNEIRYALNALKGLGDAAVQNIVEERKTNGKFESIFDFTMRLNQKSVSKKVLEVLVYSGAFDSLHDAHRAQYFANMTGENVSILDKAVKLSSSVLKEGTSPSVQTLFGDYHVIETPVIRFPVVPPLTLLEQLHHEKEVTGLYLSGHPLDNFTLEINSFCNSGLEDIVNRKGADLTLAGVVSAVAHKMTKTGKPFGLMSMEDTQGSFEFALFGEEYLKFKHFLMEGSMLMVKGRYQNRYNSEEQFEFKISNMMLLTEVREKLTHQISLLIDVDALNQNFINTLNKIINDHPGKIPFSIKLHDLRENLVLPLRSRKQKIDINSSLLEQLNKLPQVELKLN